MASEIIKYSVPCLIYDEACPLCLRFKQSLDRTQVSDNVFFYPLQDQQIYRVFPFLDKKFVKQEIHFIDESKKVHTGKDAIEKLIKYDSRVERFSWLVESKMGKKALDIFYKTSNRYRKSLRKCCHSCDH